MKSTMSSLLSPRWYRMRLVLVVAGLGLALGLALLAPGLGPTARAAAHTPARPLSSAAITLVHTATAGNSSGDYTILNEQSAFSSPNLVVQATASWNPNNACGCVYDTHALGVWFTGSYWAIFHEDGTAIPLGATYDVLAMYPNNGLHDAYIHIATANNSAGDWTTLNDPTANGNPNAVIVVTPNWNPGGQWRGVFNLPQVGVWYNGANWAIFNEDGSAIPAGAAFNVNVEPSSYAAFAQRAASASYVDEINNGYTNYQPALLLFVTPNFDPGGNCPCAFDNHPLGVYYDYNHEWSVYHQDIAAMSVGEAFNIFAFAPSS
jgi:hypothetical protein